MDILPRTNEAFIPIDRLLKYALNPEVDYNKAIAFENALGYNLDNAEELIEQVKKELFTSHAKRKDDFGYGTRYEVIMDITGRNGKTAKVLTSWIDDIKTGEMRLTTIHVD